MIPETTTKTAQQRSKGGEIVRDIREAFESSDPPLSTSSAPFAVHRGRCGSPTEIENQSTKLVEIRANGSLRHVTQGLSLAEISRLLGVDLA